MKESMLIKRVEENGLPLLRSFPHFFGSRAVPPLMMTTPDTGNIKAITKSEKLMPDAEIRNSY
jgi:hypothetical protein